VSPLDLSVFTTDESTSHTLMKARKSVNHQSKLHLYQYTEKHPTDTIWQLWYCTAQTYHFYSLDISLVLTETTCYLCWELFHRGMVDEAHNIVLHQQSTPNSKT